MSGRSLPGVFSPSQVLSHGGVAVLDGCFPLLSWQRGVWVAAGLLPATATAGCFFFLFLALAREVVVGGSALGVRGVVGFCGPRVAPVAAGLVVGRVVASVLQQGRGVATGCASGVDALAVAAALGAGAGSSLFVFAAFGPSGLGVVGSSSSVAGVATAAQSGAHVAWFAGGGPGSRPGGTRSGAPLPPARARLAARSLAFVRFVAGQGPGSGLVAVVSSPPPRPFAAGPWPACGSGSWGSLGAAALLGLPVVVFPVGWSGFAGCGSLPALPGPAGSWVPAAASGLWASAWRWVV